jgi:acetyltransferase-like isoleucine patch superfamily enzyme
MQGGIISTAQRGKVCIGNNVYIGEYSLITSNDEIVIEDNVLIGPHNHIVDFDHTSKDLGTNKSQFSFLSEKIKIQSGAWVASNCCILKGVTVGKNAIIGAGSIVNKDVPAYSVAVGNPAKIIKKFDQNK